MYFKMKTKKIFLLLILIILICILTYTLVNLRNKYKIKKDFENDIEKIISQNSSTIFSIDKIVFFSNCSATSKIADNSNIILENVYQYTDIAIYINNDQENSNSFEQENTLKEVYIDNIQFVSPASIGTPSLYYKNLYSFTKDEFPEKNLIEDSISFTLSSESEIDYSTPTLYNNCANPITISYLNNNIKTDYGIENSSNGIKYDGSLLKNCYITLNSLECTFKFDIHIKNNLDEDFICTVYIEIPLSDGENSLNDGTFKLEKETNFKFVKAN